MSEDRIRFLLSKYIHRQCSPQEEAELFSFLRELSDEQKDDLLSNIWNDFESRQELPEEEAEQILDAILTRKSRFPLKYISIAASVLIVLSAGAYFLLNSNKQLSADNNKIALADIRPGENKAELIMGNGKKILLGTGLQKITVPNTDVVIQENANGSLTYNKGTITDTEPITYDTLRTPKGGVYQLNLGDGTKIWLNTASAIRFPEKPGRRSRDVELLYGEAYFEVEHRTDAPFTVKTAAGVIRDLGTHFNVNTGTGDGQVAATLLEGAIQIETNNNIKSIKPGQQVLFNRGKLAVHEVDAEEMIAWKDGYFMFDETMESAMQKICLWYDVKVEYQDEGIKGVPVLATITRYSSISNVLHILEMTKKVRFNIDGRTVKVFYFNQNTAK